MCIVAPGDRSSLSPVGNIDQTFRGNLATTLATATPSCVSQNPPCLRKRSRSDGEFSPTSDQGVTLAQLAEHNSEDDCWLAVKGKVTSKSYRLGVYQRSLHIKLCRCTT